MLAEYNRIIEEQSSKGIISEVDSNSEIKVGRLQYLPHYPVIREIFKRFNRVVFGVTSSSFLLNGTIRHNVTSYESEDPQLVNQFLNFLYVDDFNGEKGDDSEAFELYSKARSRMKDGGSNLREFISNSQKLMQWIDHEEGVPTTEAAPVADEDQTYATTHLGMNGKTSEEGKVLGLNWDITRDAFILGFDWLVDFIKDLPLTKRSVIRVVVKL